MKLDKIYIGETYDGVEHVFYSKTASYDVDRIATVFYDLESFQKYTLMDIDPSSLIPFKTVINNNKKRLLKRNIIKTFKEYKGE